MQTFQNTVDYDYKQHRTQKDWGESQTVPSQAYSLKEILARVIQGRPQAEMQISAFTGENPENVDFDDYNPLLTAADPLTVRESIVKELSDLGLKRKKAEDEKIAEAAKKAKSDSEAKTISEYKASEAKKKSEEKSGEKPDEKSTT